MPDLEISNLPALAEAGVAATDPLAIADLSASETKKVTVKDLIEAGVALIDAASIPAAKVGTLGTDQVATGAIQDDAVTNDKLANTNISLGGISIALGGTDATPAFNLADATGYTTANLSGTITNAQLAGSIANSKLTNSSVSFGGISLALGGTDATPAFNLTDATGYKTTELVGTITNAQLAGSIDVSKLVGSTISLGGVSVALGGTDATPAFNLTDATGYPTSSLVGTITNAQLAGSIANAKLANSSVSFGGISVALGASDATPAFDLTDATNYPASSLTGTVTNAQLAGSIAVSKLVASSVSLGGVSITLGTTDATPAFDLQDATGYPTSSLVGTITNAQLAGSITADKLVSGSITSTQLGANSVTDSELANNAVDTGAVQNGAITNDKVETSTSATTGLDGATKIRDASITPAKLNTSNLDRSLNVASGNLGINNTITAATRSGITYNAQGLITGTVALAAGDLPVATTSAVGGVSVGTGLSVSGAGALSLTNSVTGATVSGITFNNQGMITAATALVAGDLPVATTSAKGAVQITSGGGLTVDGSGNLITSTSGVSAGTYQSVTVNNKGVITAGAVLTAGLIPDLAASKITSGSLDAARIGNDSIDGTKLSNTSTAIFQSIAQSGYPTAQFNGQILFDTVSEDAYIWDGNAWQAITTLTKGSLVFGGNFNANTSKMTACTSAGLAAGLAVGSNLPTPSATTDGLYVVVDTAGTPSSPAPVVAFSPPDYILGVTNSAGSSWNEIDLSQTVAGQVASNITFTPYGQLSSTNVQDALQELETEKLALAGGTVTGQVLIGNTGSLVFEGSTIDAYETTITVADPTSSDKTITFPDTTGTVITTGDTGTVTSTMLANGTIVNADINASAAIAFSKLAALTSAQILVGNGSNVVTGVAVTGDISINNAGLTAIAAGVIVDADISGSAAITGSKIATGTTSAVGVLQLTDSATSTSATTAATPAAVKIAKDAADAAATTANAALPKAGGTMTGNLILDNAKELRLSEGDSDGANYTGLKAQAQTGDITLTLPAVAPTAGQVLKANASTPTTLEWAADSATDSTKMPLAGGTFTGDVTFTGDSSNGLWDKSASAFVANLTGNVTGNASGSSGSCTGTAAVATAITIADESSDTTCFPLFATAATGDLGAKSGSNLTFNSSSGALTATSFVGALTGDVTGNVSGSAATVTGAAQSAITSVGTLTGLTVSGDVSIADKIVHTGDTNTALRFPAADTFSIETGGSERARVDSSGRLLVGATTDDGTGSLAQVAATDVTASFSARRYSNSGGPARLYLFKSRGTSIDAQTIVQNGDDLGEVLFQGSDGTDAAPAALIKAQVDGTPGNDDMPGRLVFSTTADGAVSSTERMRLDSSGRLLVNGITGQGSTAKLEVTGTLDNSYPQYSYPFMVSDDAAYDSSSGPGGGIGFSFKQNSSGQYAQAGGIRGVKENTTDGNYASKMLFYTRANGAAPTVALTIDSSQNATFAGTVSDSKGNLRSIPQNTQGSAYTLVAADAGKHILASGTITVPDSVFSAGDAVTIVNNTGGDLTITKTITTMYLGTDASSANRTLSTRGVATILFASGTVAYISGAGLS